MDESNWQELYKAALLEPDVAKLSARIDAAQTAIRARLMRDRDVLSKRELEDIENALRILRFLRNEAA